MKKIEWLKNYQVNYKTKELEKKAQSHMAWR